MRKQYCNCYVATPEQGPAAHAGPGQSSKRCRTCDTRPSSSDPVDDDMYFCACQASGAAESVSRGNGLGTVGGSSTEDDDALLRCTPSSAAA
eukprot:11802563-Alexandrium_andersonii.AAC.1